MTSLKMLGIWIAALPDDSVAVGASWKGEGKDQIVEIQDTRGHLQGRIQAKLKSLTVQGTDTVATLHLKIGLDSLSLAGTLTMEFDLGGAGRSGVPTKVSLVRVLTGAK